MTDPNLELVVADWRDAVHLFLKSPIGRGTVSSLDTAEQPIFIALLEAMVPVPYTLDQGLVDEMAKWRAGRERESRKSLDINLFATADVPPNEAEVNRKFMDLRNMANDCVREVERCVGQAMTSLLQDVQGVTHHDSDMPTVRPDVFPTRRVDYDQETLDLMEQRESSPDGVSLAVLEARLAKIISGAGQTSGEFNAIRPPSSLIPDAEMLKPPPSPAPSLESFGFKQEASDSAAVDMLDDPLGSDLELGKSHSPAAEMSDFDQNQDAPSIEVGEGVELDEDDELDLAFEDVLNSVPSRK